MREKEKKKEHIYSPSNVVVTSKKEGSQIGIQMGTP
jgi:hypothetical protein